MGSRHALPTCLMLAAKSGSMNLSAMKDHETATPGMETRLRLDVAATTLMLNKLGILEYSGHISARLPNEEAFLIQPGAKSRAEVQPEDLLVCDYTGAIIRGGPGKPPSEVYLHSEIYRARPDVTSVAHFHNDTATAFTFVHDVTLVPFKIHAVRWASGIPTHPDPGHIDNRELGRAIVRTLGPHHALQIRAHGQIITAESPRGVFVDSVHFVENAEAAYRAAALGKLNPLTPEEIESISMGTRRGAHISKLWTYYVRDAIAKGVIPGHWPVLGED